MQLRVAGVGGFCGPLRKCAQPDVISLSRSDQKRSGEGVAVQSTGPSVLSRHLTPTHPPTHPTHPSYPPTHPPHPRSRRAPLVRLFGFHLPAKPQPGRVPPGLGVRGYGECGRGGRGAQARREGGAGVGERGGAAARREGRCFRFCCGGGAGGRETEAATGGRGRGETGRIRGAGEAQGQAAGPAEGVRPPPEAVSDAGARAGT